MVKLKNGRWKRMEQFQHNWNNLTHEVRFQL